MNPEHQGLVTKTMTTVNAIYAALVFSTLIYIGIAFLMLQQDMGETAFQDKRIPAVVAAVGVLMLLLARPMQKLLEGQPAIGDTPESRCRQFQTATIVGQAIRESAAIIGFVLTLMTGDIVWVAGLAFLSILAMVVNWPRRSRLEERFKEVPTIG